MHNFVVAVVAAAVDIVVEFDGVDYIVGVGAVEAQQEEVVRLGVVVVECNKPLLPEQLLVAIVGGVGGVGAGAVEQMLELDSY